MKTTAKTIKRIEGMESLSDGIYDGHWRNNIVRFASGTSTYEATTVPIVRGPSVQVKVLVSAGVVTVVTLNATNVPKVGAF